MTIPKDKSWWRLERACRTIGGDQEEAERAREWELAATFIAETVQEAISTRTVRAEKNITLLDHHTSLVRFLETTSIIHQHLWDEWMRLHGSHGSPERPFKTLKKNYKDQDAVPYDYGKLRGIGLEDWPDFWTRNYSRPGARNPGTFREPLKSLPKAPLVAVYRRLNGWWVSVLDQPFWPDFSAVLGSLDDMENALPNLGPAAHTFFLVAEEMNRDYTLLHCKRVHDDEYRFLNHKKS